jgi:hypothetical protein
VISVLLALAGGVNETAALVPFLVAVPIVGAAGMYPVYTVPLAPLAALVPRAFVAVIVNLYDVLFVNPDTVIGDVVPVPVKLPGVDVIVYPVIVYPPVSDGGVNAALTEPLPGVITPSVGAAGALPGITLLLATLDAPAPAVLTAATVNVYDVPLVNPDILTGDTVPVPVNPPGLDVTVYDDIGMPPLSVGAVNATAAELSPNVALIPVGALATLPGTTTAVSADAAPTPLALVATTIKVYCAPFVSPVIVIGDAPPDVAVKPGFVYTV